jgi:single-strand DNA-binding protein
MKNNEIRVLGNLVKDPEIIETDKISFSKIRIATNTRYNKGPDNFNERSCFIDVKLFGRAHSDFQYYTPQKGDRVFVDGELVYEEWTDSNGNARSNYVIHANSLLKIHRNAKVT